MHASVVVLAADVPILKKPLLQGSHTGWLVLDPATAVNFPASHFVCCVHVITPPWYDARTEFASGLHVNAAYTALE
jgi:hypothetical protein